MYNSKLVFTAACICLFVFGMSIICLGSILPEIVDKFQVNELAAGGLASLLPLGILTGSLLFGPIADRYGYKGLLILSCLLVLFGMEGLAMGNKWSIIQLSIYLIGTGGGALNGAASALVADISEGERGAKLSILGVFYGLGALGMPLIISALSSFYSGTMIIGGVGYMILLLVAFIAFITFPKAKQQAGFPVKEGLKLLKSPIILLFGMALFFQSGLEGLVSNWSNGYLQSEMKVAGNLALMGLTIHMAAITLMRLALSRLLKTYADTTILQFSFLLILLGSIVFWQADSYAMVLLALVLLGLGFAGIFPIFLGKIGDLWTELSGTAFSIIFVIALLGNTLINYFMGVLSYHYSIRQLPVLLIVCVLLMGGFMLGARKYWR